VPWVEVNGSAVRCWLCVRDEVSEVGAHPNAASTDCCRSTSTVASTVSISSTTFRTRRGMRSIIWGGGREHGRIAKFTQTTATIVALELHTMWSMLWFRYSNCLSSDMENQYWLPPLCWGEDRRSCWRSQISSHCCGDAELRPSHCCKDVSAPCWTSVAHVHGSCISLYNILNNSWAGGHKRRAMACDARDSYGENHKSPPHTSRRLLQSVR
jgi:hypothetical protein